MRLKALKNLRKSESIAGQATIEFALTLILLFSLMMFYIQFCFLCAYGNLVHYATFISARALLSSGPTKEDQYDRARNALVGILKKSGGGDRWPMIAKADPEVGSGDVPGLELWERDDSEGLFQKTYGKGWLQGVRYTFRGRLFLLTSKNSRTKPELKLTSESWLGRDPSVQECQTHLQTDIGGAVNGGPFIDNGC